MREGWERSSLVKIVRLNYGKAMRDVQRVPGDVPVVGSAGIFGWHDTPNVNTEHSIVVGRKGSAGSVRWFDKPVWVTDTAYWVEPTGDLDLQFLFLLLQHANLPGITAQTGVPGLNRERAYEVVVLLPPLPEQRRIVDLIGALDEAIEASAQLADGSLHREMVAGFIEDLSETKKPLLAALTVSRTRAKVGPGDRYRILGVLRSGEGFIDRGEMSGDVIGYSHLTPVQSNQLVYRKLTAWEGPISVSTDLEDGGYVSNEFPVFDIDPAHLDPNLMRHLCRSETLWKAMGARLTGSVLRRKRLNPEQLLEVEVPMPARQVQHQVAATLDAALELEAAARQQLESSQLVRSAAVSALLSGDHEIPASYDRFLEGVSGA